MNQSLSDWELEISTPPNRSYSNCLAPIVHETAKKTARENGRFFRTSDNLGALHPMPPPCSAKHHAARVIPLRMTGFNSALAHRGRLWVGRHESGLENRNPDHDRYELVQNCKG